MKQLRIALYVLGAMVLIALTEMGRTAVNRSYNYRELTAPKSLHQLSLEARGGPDDRNGTLLLGAGLFAGSSAVEWAASAGGRQFTQPTQPGVSPAPPLRKSPMTRAGKHLLITVLGLASLTVACGTASQGGQPPAASPLSSQAALDA